MEIIGNGVARGKPQYGELFVIEAGTIGSGAWLDEGDRTVVAVIELTQAEVEKLTGVCGHDGFGMLPEAAEEILLQQLGERAREGS